MSLPSYPMIKNQKLEKNENLRFYGQNRIFFGTLDFSLREILSTWLHVGAPKKCRKNEFTTHFEQKFTMGSFF
jgi:hypothetical protein